jgi:hypothetical protein
VNFFLPGESTRKRIIPAVEYFFIKLHLVSLAILHPKKQKGGPLRATFLIKLPAIYRPMLAAITY